MADLPDACCQAVSCGLQLLAEATGGEVGLARAAEVGFGKVELNALGLAHPELGPKFREILLGMLK